MQEEPTTTVGLDEQYCIVATIYPDFGAVDTDVIIMREHEDAIDACLRAYRSSGQDETQKGGNYPKLADFEAALRGAGIDPQASFFKQYPKSQLEKSPAPESDKALARLYVSRASQTAMKQLGYFLSGSLLP